MLGLKIFGGVQTFLQTPFAQLLPPCPIVSLILQILVTGCFFCFKLLCPIIFLKNCHIWSSFNFLCWFFVLLLSFFTRSRKTVESEKVKWRQRVRQRPLFAAGCSAPGYHRTLCTLYMHKCTPGYHRKHIHHSAIQLNRQAWKSRLADRHLC